MLIETLSTEERAQLYMQARGGHDAAFLALLNTIAWARLRDRWDTVVWKFWILKTLRYRDLEPVWTTLFGPRPW